MALLVLACSSPAAAFAQADSLQIDPTSSTGPGTAEVFRRYADRVVKIQIVETGSAAKSTVGSGFYVSNDGLVTTNYHVVSQVITDSGRYRAELFDRSGESHPLRVLAIDVVHDLAIVKADFAPERAFTLAPVSLAQGERLYALGHPLDLGLTINEGTYNGKLRHVLYDKLLFTGSLSPGMSGGPAIDAGGHVVGINVSTAGNEVSFLVPVERAVALLAAARSSGDSAGKGSFLDVAARQLREYQDVYLEGIFSDSGETVTLGGYTLPTQPAPFFRCWADAYRDPDDPYDLVRHQCSTDDEVYLSSDQSTGTLELTYDLLISNSLNTLRFYSLLSNRFSTDNGDFRYADEDDVTPFRCESGNIERQGHLMRTVFCVRKYRKLSGLYDVIVKAVLLGDGKSGVLATLSLYGVTFANAHEVARHYLERISWAQN
jgi:hypothetical protein